MKDTVSTSVLLFLLATLLAGCGGSKRAHQPVPARQPLQTRPVADGAPAFLWPLGPVEILSPFGAQRRDHRHTGVDLRGRSGDPVMAAAAGKVTFVGTMRGYGKTVILDHGRGFETLYAHNRTLLVSNGSRVSSGEKIALVGNTGNATTDHCHFEIRREGVPLDPRPFLPDL